MRLSYIALVCFVLSIFSTHAYGQVTAIKAGRLIDPASGTASLNQIILIEKDKITAIGGEVAIPAGATVIDLSRSTILPGLFDMHTHLCLDVHPVRDAGNYYYTTLNDADAFRSIQGVVNGCAALTRLASRWLTAQMCRIIAPFGGQFRLNPDKQNLRNSTTLSHTLTKVSQHLFSSYQHRASSRVALTKPSFACM